MNPRHFVLFFILLLCTALAAADIERVTLNINESVLVADKNITLLRVNWDIKKAVLCINNNKKLISNDLTIDNGYIELIDISSDSVKLKIKADCKNCRCAGDCLNLKCFETYDKKEDKKTDSLNLSDMEDLTLKLNETLEENKEDILEKGIANKINVEEEGMSGLVNFQKVFSFLVILTILFAILVILKKRVK